MTAINKKIVINLKDDEKTRFTSNARSHGMSQREYLGYLQDVEESLIDGYSIDGIIAFLRHLQGNQSASGVVSEAFEGFEDDTLNDEEQRLVAQIDSGEINPLEDPPIGRVSEPEPASSGPVSSFFSDLDDDAPDEPVAAPGATVEDDGHAKMTDFTVFPAKPILYDEDGYPYACDGTPLSSGDFVFEQNDDDYFIYSISEDGDETIPVAREMLEELGFKLAA